MRSASDSERTASVRAAALVLAALLVWGFLGAAGWRVQAASASDADACPPASLPATTFLDAEGTHGDSIRCLAWYGLAEGLSDGEFGAYDPVGRGQASTLLLNVLVAAGADLPRTGPSVFADAAGSTHEDAIGRLAAAGIMHGTSAGEADPWTVVTREQFTSFVVRGVEYIEERSLGSVAHGFDDVQGTHADAIAAASAAGFVDGVSADDFGPRRPVDRGQAASILAGVLDRFVADGRLGRPPAPEFVWAPARLTPSMRERMTGTSWRPGCPVGLDALRAVALTHRGFDGRIHRGELIVHVDAVDDLARIFEVMYDTGFPLDSVMPAHLFDGDDDASMAANNSHAFNCRAITGGSSWSEHSHGTAIDLNPVQNPYQRNATVLPAAGARYLDRTDHRPGMLGEGGPVMDAFDTAGWEWGGRWNSLVDYMHLELRR